MATCAHESNLILKEGKEVVLNIANASVYIKQRIKSSAPAPGSRLRAGKRDPHLFRNAGIGLAAACLKKLQTI
jgi:hypothetical protein